MADMLFKSPVQPGWPDLQWRNMSQGSFNYRTLASGVVVATLATGGGILKAIWMDDYNNGQISVDAPAGIGSIGTWGSGALDIGWNPCWMGFTDTLIVHSATAQLFAALVGTGLGALQW